MDPQPPAFVLPDSVRQFLTAPRFATISTLNPDGGPHQAVVWYVLDGDRIVINSRPGRRWPQNLEHDPRISIAIYDDANPEHWIGLRGSAAKLHEGEAATADIKALARRYGSDPEKYRDQARISFAVRIDSSFEYGA